MNIIRVRHFFMHNDFIINNNVKTLSLRSTQSLQWANSLDSDFVHVSDLTLNNQVKLRMCLTLMKFRIWNTFVRVRCLASSYITI